MLKRIALRARQTDLKLRNRRAVRTALRIESLEARTLMTANSADPSQFTLSHGSGVCNCPICTGAGLDQIPVFEAAATVGGTSTASLAASSPLSSLPALSSLPSASAKIYLDFNGHTEAAWGEFRNVVTPVYDIDGDRSTFSATELSNIQQIWARVAEDYAPFNIDVTTIDPGNFANKVAVRVAIGGNYSDWFGDGAGGVAYIGGFYNNASNVAYVFEDALGNGNARYVAEAASHEAGHTFGLDHQSLWSGSTLVDAYNEGNASWAPIMGVGYYSARTTWHNGATSDGPTAYQDDMAILSNASNGFGYRADDHGSTPQTATPLTSNVNLSGVIERTSDVDMFSFTTTGGVVNLTLNVAQFGANFDSQLRIRTLEGHLLAMSDPTDRLGASLNVTMPAGTYYVVVRGVHSGDNVYGNVGQYTLTGTVPVTASQSAPEIDVAVAGIAVADGGSVAFGSTVVGSAATRQITITNTGNQVLSLTPINPATVPAGFSLVSNISVTSLSPGASHAFTVRMNAAAVGSFGGVLTINSNDGNEASYELSLTGTVTAAAPAPVVRTIDNGAAGYTSSGTWYRQTGIGRESDINYALAGNGSATATWNFTGLPAGTYRVYATYPASRSYATNSPFLIYNGNALLATQRVNQEVLPTTVIDGSRYLLLGTYTITGNQLVVRLSNAANQFVVADAIRIEQVLPSAGAMARAAEFGGKAAANALAIDLVHSVVGQTPAATSAPVVTNNLAARLNAVSQQLTAVTTRLQSLVNSRAVDHAFAQGNVLSGDSAGSSSTTASDVDSLLTEEADWLALN